MHDFAGTPVATDAPRERVQTGESLVVLTRDPALVRTLKGLGSAHHIATVAGESDLTGELMGEHTGVAIIDAAAVSPPVERLTGRLKSQFPDVVLIVAGKQDDQSALAAQITNGTVYRFLHKPVSEQRVRLFVDAAWRRHGAGHSGVTDSLTTTGVQPERATAALPRSVLVGGGVTVAALVVIGGGLMTRKPTPAPAPNAATAAAGALPSAVRDEQFEDLLSRADKALEAGALVAPPGASAADLYKQAMHRNGGDPRAAAGIEKVIDRLLSAAEPPLAARHLDQAQRLIDQARAIKPDHVRVAFLATQIGKERERAALTRARQAASNGNIAGAMPVLDGAMQEGKVPTPVVEARQEPEQNKLDDRVSDYLAKAAEPPQTEAKADVKADAKADDKASTEAHDLRVDDANTANTEHDMTAGQDAAKRAAEVVQAGSLQLEHYTPPTFPPMARQRGVSGWVDVQFLVRTDGSVSDAIIVGAEPAGCLNRPPSRR